MKLKTILLTTGLFAISSYEVAAKYHGPTLECERTPFDYLHMGIKHPHSVKDVANEHKLDILRGGTQSLPEDVKVYFNSHLVDFLPQGAKDDELRVFASGLSEFSVDQLEKISLHIAPLWTENVSLADRLKIMQEAVNLDDFEKRAFHVSHWMRRILMTDSLHRKHHFFAEPIIQRLTGAWEMYPMDLNKVRGLDYTPILIALLKVDPDSSKTFESKMKAAEKALKQLIQRPAKQSRYDVIARDLRPYIISALLHGTTEQIEVIGRYGAQFFTHQMNSETRGKVIENLIKGTPEQIQAILENPNIRFIQLSNDAARGQVFEALLKLDASQIRKAGVAFKKREVSIPSFANPGVPTQAAINAVVNYLNGLQIL